jgi:hypothetical protein
MYDNNSYNLMRQMVEEHKMLWQIKNNYLSDAAKCTECHEFWESIIKQGEQRIAKLEELLRKHMT